MTFQALSWTLTLISVLGTLLIIRRRVSGFYLWTISNLGWIVIDWQAGINAQAVLFVIYLATSIYGAWEWHKNN